MAQINAYLNFNGECREAMNFYKDCFGGTLTLQEVGDSPMCDRLPPEKRNDIMHSMLQNDDFILMGSDMSGAEMPKGSSIALSLNCKSMDEAERLFASLSNSGRIIEALGEKFWGGVFGVVQDKYQTVWLFNYQKNQHQQEA